ncbi:MAG: Crp/Fnr family transcriptional regulator [Burkholderiaceae bacterium]|nr:Crp/Fnr family transcriptional regulator [Burkholderiaceae bacterium]
MQCPPGDEMKSDAATPASARAALAALCAHYPAVAALDPATCDAVLREHAQSIEVPAGTVLFDEGAPCRGFPLVLDGEIRVARGSPQGRSLELYRVGAGELCVVSTSCLFGQRTMVAHGVATRPTRLVVLSPAGFDAWCAHAAFRRFVFGIFAERLADLMALVEAVAFQRLDQRLAANLLGHGTVVHASHQALADQLGTVREIVTRLLRQFERAGWVRVARERTELLDAAALRHLAGDRPPP